MTRFAFLLLLTVIGLAGCGKRASMVDPPESARNNGYPRSYPDIGTDPEPTYQR